VGERNEKQRIKPTNQLAALHQRLMVPEAVENMNYSAGRGAKVDHIPLVDREPAQTRAQLLARLAHERMFP
jgi:hypothetical protein